MLSVDNSRSGILCACVNLDEGLYVSSAVREAIRELTQQNYRKVQGKEDYEISRFVSIII